MKSEETLEVADNPGTPSVEALDWRRIPWVVGAATLLASLNVPISYDEAYWQAITRLVESGRPLYDGAIDNKTPVVYGLVWMLQALPGGLVVWRAVTVGALTGVLSYGFHRVIGGEGWRGAWPVALLVGNVLVMNELTLTTELLAMPLLLLPMVSERFRSPVSTSVLLLTAVALDPRTVLLLPGLILCLDGLAPAERRRLIALLGAGLALALTAAFSVPDLRFGLIEMNIASRNFEGTSDVERLVGGAWIILVGFVPFVLAVGSSGRSPGKLVLLAGAILIPILSVIPNPHYWTYLTLSLALFVRVGKVPTSPVLAGSLLILALTPLAIRAGGVIVAHAGLSERSVRVIDALDSHLEHGDPYAIFGTLPQVVAARPDGYLLRSSTSLYLGTTTSRSDDHLDELPALLSSSKALVDTGALAAPRDLVYAQNRPSYDVFRAELASFECSVAVDSITIWLRTESCER